ncbi:MAG: amidophosphoribosyltransferase [Tissierellia bacterium]|nr:amidophosphoribosyltransferase [Tissierellia bacterium]
MAGIIGILGKHNVVRQLFYGMNSLQHRGQVGCGMAVLGERGLSRERGAGLVIDFFTPEKLKTLSGNIGLGVVRYDTESGNSNMQSEPFFGYTKGEKLAIVNDGRLVNSDELRNALEKEGMMFQTTSDTEIILYLISRNFNGDIVSAIKTTMKYLKGSYSFILLYRDKLIAVRDPHGIRPLLLGKREDEFIFMSENAAADILGFDVIKDIKPGSIVIANGKGLRELDSGLKKSKKFCIFEHVYLARSDATPDGLNSYLFRWNSGKILYRESPVEADLVVSVPDSGNPAAIGYSLESGIPLGEGLVKNRYMGRTFIKPTREEREISVRLKLNPQKHIVKGKKLVLIDDSLVRGTTSKNLIHNLREAGAKEIHLRLASPAVKFPCFYGIDTPDREHLIAANYDLDTICKMIGADSLNYISLKGLYEAGNCDKNQFCDACFTGKYIDMENDLEG